MTQTGSGTMERRRPGREGETGEGTEVESNEGKEGKGEGSVVRLGI